MFSSLALGLPLTTMFVRLHSQIIKIFIKQINWVELRWDEETATTTAKTPVYQANTFTRPLLINLSRAQTTGVFKS